jgi:hypothetical protein
MKETDLFIVEIKKMWILLHREYDSFLLGKEVFTKVSLMVMLVLGQVAMYGMVY